jgi:uncharacterized protein YwgA
MAEKLKLNDEENLLIVALGALDGAPIRSKIKLQKMLFLISNLFDNYKDILEYEPHLYGPYSEVVEETLQDLMTLGLVNESINQYTLTSKGKEVYLDLKIKKEVLQVMSDFKNFLNDLSQDEVLVFVYACYPKFISESIKWNELKPKRIAIALSLLKKGKISYSKALEVSGINQAEFEKKIKEQNIAWK